jgi:hypothetical protein
MICLYYQNIVDMKVWSTSVTSLKLFDDSLVLLILSLQNLKFSGHLSVCLFGLGQLQGSLVMLIFDIAQIFQFVILPSITELQLFDSKLELFYFFVVLVA